MTKREWKNKYDFKGFPTIPEKLYRIIQYRGCTIDTSYKRKFENRVMKAKEQLKKANKSIEEKIKSGKTVEEINEEFIKEVEMKAFEFLHELKIKTMKSAKISLPRYTITPDELNEYKDVTIDYKKLKNAYNLNNENHIVWMKFAKCEKSGREYLGVVAASNDVNFSPHQTSDNIIKELGLVWDESFVLVFPFAKITDGMRNDIEVGIGNYLIMDTEIYNTTDEIIEGNISMLDFYSHRFQ